MFCCRWTHWRPNCLDKSPATVKLKYVPAFKSRKYKLYCIISWCLLIRKLLNILWLLACKIAIFYSERSILWDFAPCCSLKQPFLRSQQSMIHSPIITITLCLRLNRRRSIRALVHVSTNIPVPLRLISEFRPFLRRFRAGASLVCGCQSHLSPES